MKKLILLTIFVMLPLYLLAEQMIPDNITITPELIKAAEAGDAKSQFELAVAYSDEAMASNNIDKYKESLKWFKSSACQSDCYMAVNSFYIFYTYEILNDKISACAWAYLSKDETHSSICDNTLSSAQLTRSLHTMEQMRLTCPIAQ